MDSWCRHCKPGKGGCSIYSERPNVCKAFGCGWLLNGTIGDEWFPARSKIVIHYHRDGPYTICAFVVDSAYPQRWREQPFYSGIKQAALAGLSQHGAGHFLTRVEIGARKIVVLPDQEVEVGSKPHTIVQVGEQQWDALCFETPEQAAEVTSIANVMIERIAAYPEDQRDTMLFELNRKLAASFGVRSSPGITTTLDEVGRDAATGFLSNVLTGGSHDGRETDCLRPHPGHENQIGRWTRRYARRNGVHGDGTREAVRLRAVVDVEESEIDTDTGQHIG
jgi:hypothetical protein